MKKLQHRLRYYCSKVKRIFIKDASYKQLNEVYDIMDEMFKPLIWVNADGVLMYGSVVRCGPVIAICDMELSAEARENYSIDQNLVIPVFGIILEANEIK
ncbi:MAG: hypothetical protein WAQ28_02025 [Bacteroidia bacterium]